MRAAVAHFFKYHLRVVAVLSIASCYCLVTSAQGFQSIIELNPLAVAKTTGEKPQSKVWNHAGKWWAVFPVTTGTYIWKLNGASWTNVLKISSSTSVEADCKVLGDVSHIFLWRSGKNASQLISVQYNKVTSTYELWSERSATAFIQLDSGAETGTIDIDSNARMWLASDGVDDIRVRWSDPPYVVWSEPHILASGVTNDDICAVVALPVQGQIGVLWSDQNAKRFGFKTHTDGASAGLWSADEMPALQSSLNIGQGMGDDHLNVATSADGTLYCAVKTSYDTPGYTRLALLKRSAEGNWDDLYHVSESGTRGIVILNENSGKIKVIYTSQEDGGDILYRESPTSVISFGPAVTLISGKYNNVTSSKNNYHRDIVVLASDAATLVGVLASDTAPLTVGTTPPREEVAASLFPNPVAYLITLNIISEPDEVISISIADSSGRICFHGKRKIKNHTLNIDVTNFNLRPGLHLLIVETGNRSHLFRFIKT